MLAARVWRSRAGGDPQARNYFDSMHALGHVYIPNRDAESHMPPPHGFAQCCWGSPQAGDENMVQSRIRIRIPLKPAAAPKKPISCNLRPAGHSLRFHVLQLLHLSRSSASAGHLENSALQAEPTHLPPIPPGLVSLKPSSSG